MYRHTLDKWLIGIPAVYIIYWECKHRATKSYYNNDIGVKRIYAGVIKRYRKNVMCACKECHHIETWTKWLKFIAAIMRFNDNEANPQINFRCPESENIENDNIL